MFKTFVIISLLFSAQLCAAQTVVGTWKTYDIFNKHKEEAIVDISIVNDSLQVKIVKILVEEHKNDACIKCTDTRKDQPILGMTILKGATLKDGLWQGALILNAKNGKEYGCHISMESPDVLKVRGFIGYPFFGKNLYWNRVVETADPEPKT